MPDLSESARRIDSTLSEVQDAYTFLAVLQPTNTDEAWSRFEGSGFEEEPSFEYRPMETDTDALRQRLEELDLNEVEDPGLLYFLESKREELALELELMASRNTRQFLARSIRLYGPVQQSDVHEAEVVLERLHPDEVSGDRDDHVLKTDAIRRMVEEELEHYRRRDPSFEGRLESGTAEDGFRADGARLLFPEEMSLPERRARALTQHEVGVHLVTHHNGCRQPLQLLSRGLSSYDELQEAFGALAEHFAGGFTAARLRTLAARLLAAEMTEQEAHFVDVFRRLTRDHGFKPRGAFHITARVHQAGGFTRDQIYLRGLLYLLRYIEAGGDLELLYLGKVGHREVPVLRELRRKGLLREPPLRPRFLETDHADERLGKLREGMEVTALVNG